MPYDQSGPDRANARREARIRPEHRSNPDFHPRPPRPQHPHHQPPPPPPPPPHYSGGNTTSRTRVYNHSLLYRLNLIAAAFGLVSVPIWFNCPIARTTLLISVAASFVLLVLSSVTRSLLGTWLFNLIMIPFRVATIGLFCASMVFCVARIGFKNTPLMYKARRTAFRTESILPDKLPGKKQDYGLYLNSIIEEPSACLLVRTTDTAYLENYAKSHGGDKARTYQFDSKSLSACGYRERKKDGILHYYPASIPSFALDKLPNITTTPQSCLVYTDPAKPSNGWMIDYSTGVLCVYST